MQTTYTISELRTHIGDITRQVQQRQSVTVTDKGNPTAVIMSTEDLEDLEGALAVARLERDRALGKTGAPIPHEQARQMLLEASGQRDDQDAPS